MQKIYKNLGNHEIASKCISTCIIKSFKNNNHLLYLLSTCELAHLNFIYGNKNRSENINTLEENILSHSNSYINSFKNVLQFITTNRGDFISIENKSKFYFKYVYFSLLLNTLRDGYHSFSIFYFKTIFNNLKDNLIETSNILLFLLYNIYEYDVNFSLEKFYEISRRYINEDMLELFVYKLDALSGLKINPIINNNNIYIYVSSEYLRLSCNSLNDDEIIKFKNFCKEKKFKKYKNLALILLAESYINKDRISEALYILKKTILNCSDNYIEIKANITMLKLFLKLNNNQKCLEICSLIENKINKIGSIEDKFYYYYINSSISVDNEYYLKNAIKYALCMNNIKFIENTINRIKQSNIFINEKTYLNFIYNRNELIKIKSNIKIKNIEKLEIHYALINNSKIFLNEIINN